MMHLTDDEASGAHHDPELELLDLTCPSCDADLIADELFLSHRVCSTCHRHFSVSARERIGFLADGGEFEEHPKGGAGVATVPIRDQLPSAERIAEHQHLQVIDDAVVTATARVGGVTTIVVALDDHLVSASLGALLTDKIIHALDDARSRRLPVVLIVAGGSAAQSGPLSLIQGSRLASDLARLHLEGLPVIGILVHPMPGSLFSALAVHCDVVLAEPGVQVGSGFARPGGPPTARRSGDELLAGGWIDDVVERSALPARVGHTLDLLCNPGTARFVSWRSTSESAHGSVSDALAALRHPGRPNAATLLQHVVSGFVELHGDRIDGDDATVTCGIGRCESLTVAVAATNGEPATPVAARKISRLARLASRLELPLILLVDGGLDPSDDDEFDPAKAHAAGAVAAMTSMMPVPVVSVGVGAVGGWLAPSLMTGDRQYLLSHGVYLTGGSAQRRSGGPRPPRGPARVIDGITVLTARECERLGMVDGVIQEPARSTADPASGMAAPIRHVVLAALAELTGTGQRRLVDARHRRQRSLGQSTPEGLAAARSELWELHEWQRSVGRSIDEWRVRWEQLKASQPRLSFQRPDMSDIAMRLRTRRAELLDRARSHDRS